MLGCGAVGLLACAIAHVFGAAHVTAVDIDPLRCQIAEKEGFADKTVVLPRLPKPESPDEGLKNGEATAKDIISKCSPAPEGYDVVGLPGVLMEMQCLQMLTRLGISLPGLRMHRCGILHSIGDLCMCESCLSA